jgi:hypothetical protein
MDVRDFENGYWYLDQLKDFAARIGIPAAKKLRKDELEKAIVAFLRTGRAALPTKRSLGKAGIKDVERGLNLKLRIEHYTSNRETKDFIVAQARILAPAVRERSGIWYRLNRWREEQITSGKHPTYGDLVRQYVALNKMPRFEKIFDRALTVLLEQLERLRSGKATRPRRQQRVTSAGSRHVPSAVKREVWARDDGRCAFLGAAGRCTETGFLEYHHVVPYADGGETSAANIQLRCRAHNAYEAEEWFGPLLARERGSDQSPVTGRSSEPLDARGTRANAMSEDPRRRIQC